MKRESFARIVYSLENKTSGLKGRDLSTLGEALGNWVKPGETGCSPGKLGEARGNWVKPREKIMSGTRHKIKTSNLLLQPINESDIYPVWKGLSHPEVIKYYGVSFHTLEETKVQMEWYATIEKNGTGQWWAVCDPDDQHFYGAIGFNDIHPVHHRAEIGFWLLPEYWGKGYMPEAASHIIKYGFEEMKLHRIYAYVESENLNSKRVLQKLGFELEGTMKECEMKNGKWIDLEMYAIKRIHRD